MLIFGLTRKSSANVQATRTLMHKLVRKVAINRVAGARPRTPLINLQYTQSQTPSWRRREWTLWRLPSSPPQLTPNVPQKQVLEPPLHWRTSTHEWVSLISQVSSFRALTSKRTPTIPSQNTRKPCRTGTAFTGPILHGRLFCVPLQALGTSWGHQNCIPLTYWLVSPCLSLLGRVYQYINDSLVGQRYKTSCLSH